MKLLAGLSLLLFSCSASIRVLPPPAGGITGSAFYERAAPLKVFARDSAAMEALGGGSYPDFLSRFVPIKLEAYDSLSRKWNRAVVYVMPDYLSIGNNEDWARVPMRPQLAQRFADSFHCFLPTRKLADAIYKAARVKLEPLPLFALRDSTPTFYHHHLMIEGQRKGRKGLIAGIKKDVVISGAVTRHARKDRVAIYGWHRSNGVPIQPLYAGHVDWWVDYSHGIRLVYRKLKVNGRWMDYTAVLQDRVLKRLICDEEDCDFYRYAY
jgi:hypothetical protein